MKRSGQIALGGMFGALSLVCLLGTVFPYGLYALPALAGVMLLPLALEFGTRWGLAGYAAVGLLALFVTPSMEAKVLFLAFFGYYPTLKLWLEGHTHRWVGCLIKFAVFNLTMVGSYVLMLRVFGLPADSFELFGVSLPLVFLAAGNVIFWVFDAALTGVVQMYWKKWHPRFCRMFH